jgi:16S rRNA (cytosine967-C5)-methyltransferase
MYWPAYFQISLQLIRGYDGDMPLAYYLKQYFAEHKKHGSRDRKWITHFCYAYYRIGHAVADLSTEDRLRIALLLADPRPDADFFPADWRDIYEKDPEDRLHWLQKEIQGFQPDNIFPWTNQLSAGVDASHFNKSHLKQPDLFLRIRPGHEKQVKQQLESAGIPFRIILDECMALANTTRLDGIVALNRQAVIQDYSSQQVGSIMQLIQTSKPLHVWDACAASGGKSILAVDKLPVASLLVSDIRTSILQNLRKRFSEAGISSYQTLLTDLARHDSPRPAGLFDLVICDVPCSGSGTWSRTPEQLCFFREERITDYANLQQQVVTAVLPFIKQGGWLLYTTCSVFAGENEMLVSYIHAQPGWIILKQALFTGYTNKADTLFGALLQKL